MMPRWVFVPLLCLLIQALAAHARFSLDAYPNGTLVEAPTFVPTPVVARGCKTNAECFKRGLPPLKPSPRRLAPRGGPSARVVTAPVRVYPAGAGPTRKRSRFSKREPTVIGYLSNAYNNGATGRYYSVTQDPEDALHVTVDLNFGGPQNIVTDKSVGMPALCGVVGPSSTDNSLTAGSSNYAVFAQCTNSGTAFSPADESSNPNSFSSADSEAAMWQVDTTTLRLTALWTNPNDVTPASVSPAFVYSSDGDLAMTCDSASMIQNNDLDQVVEFYIALIT